MRKRANQAFSLIEVLVALVLAGGGIALIVGALGNIDRAEVHNLQAEKLQRIAYAKLDEILATKDYTTTSGDFSTEGWTDLQWEMTDDTTSVTDLNHITVTVSTTSGANVSRSVSTVVYKQPSSTGGTQ